MVDRGTETQWSSILGDIATSVDEAEYNALVKAAAEGSGLVAFGHDLGYEFSLLIWVSSSTAKAIATRLCLPEVRYMEVKFLWVKEALRHLFVQFARLLLERESRRRVDQDNDNEGNQGESVGGLFSSAEAQSLPSASLKKKKTTHRYLVTRCDHPLGSLHEPLELFSSFVRPYLYRPLCTSSSSTLTPVPTCS